MVCGYEQKSKLAIVPAGTANEEDTPEQQFEKLYELGRRLCSP